MTTTFEFVCETFVITYKGKICSDSNKYIVSYGWHWNQWIWRSSSRCECVDQLGQLGCLASCVLAHLVVQYTFYLFFKIHFISFFLVKIYFIFFAHLVVQNTLSQIEYTLVLPSQHNTTQNSKCILSWHFRVSQFFLVLPSLRPCSSRRRDWSSNVTCRNIYIFDNCFSYTV